MNATRSAAPSTPRFSSMLAAWEAHVESHPEAESVHYFDQSLTVAQVDEASASMAAALQERASVVPGDRVAIYLQNDPQWLVTMLACWKCGAIPVATNPMLRGKELTELLADSGARVLVCLDSLYDDVVRQVRGATSLSTVITTHPLDLTPGAKPPPAISSQWRDRRRFSDTLDWNDLLASFAGHTPFAPAPRPEDVAILTYTSGTTGRSKGAMNLHRGMVHSAGAYVDGCSLGTGDVIVGVAPVFHITGIVASLGVHILAGTPVVLLHRFDAAETLRAIEARRGTFMVAASTAYVALSSHPEVAGRDLATMTNALSGGAAVSRALVERVHAATGWTIRGVYGMTETTSPTHLAPAGSEPPVDADTGALAVGLPVSGAEVRIVDPNTGEEVRIGEPGEIIVRGPMVVPGYWNRPEETSAAIRAGWLHTGDLGKISDDGWLFVVDRLKDIINAGGYKVYPRDVEDVLCQHPAVREASVVGVPDEYRGETVKAFVSLLPGAHAESQELIDYCRARMAAYKYPRFVEILDDLPRTATGKLLRRGLRTSAKTG